MSGWRIAKLGVTEIRVHPSLLVFVLYAGLTGYGGFIAAAVASIALHEAAHAAAAALMGNAPSGIEITPLGAVMYLDDERVLPPAQRLVMLLSGPGLSLLMCWLSLQLTSRGILPAAYGQIAFACNLSILMINLLPALPLDGGRILMLALERILPFSRVQTVMRLAGSVIGLLLIGMNLYISWLHGGWNLSLALAGCCLLYCAVRCTTTQALAELRKLMDRKILLERKGILPVSYYGVMHVQPLRQIVRCLPTNRIAIYICIEAGTMRHMGNLTEYEAVSLYMSNPGMRVCDAFNHVSSG